MNQYELLHGLVLVKLVNNSKGKRTLRLIETSPDTAYGEYIINDTINLFAKYCTVPRGKKAKTWHFTFTEKDIKQIEARGSRAYVVLICGQEQFDSTRTELCLLKPDDLFKLLDIVDLRPQGVSVKGLFGKQLRVSNSNLKANFGKQEILVPQNALETWIIPGS